MRFNIFSKTKALSGIGFLAAFVIICWAILSKEDIKQTVNKPLLKKELMGSARVGEASVQSTISKAEDRTIFLKLSGITEPSQTLEVESRLSGSIKKIFVKEGAFVKKGTPLVELSLEDRLQKLEAAKTLVKLREMQSAAAVRLSEKQFISPISLADTKKNLSEAQLFLAQARLDLSHLIVRAPFDGVVNQFYIEPGTVFSNMSMDRKICTFLNLNPLSMIVYVTEKVYEQLKVGQSVHVELIDGRKLEGKIIYISSMADTKTKTFKVKISIPNQKHILPSGMTGIVTIPLQVQRTHKLHPSWVTLSTEGVTGVMAIERGVATFYPITILDSSPSHLYVAGLPDQLEIITLGQETIASGTPIQTKPHMNPEGRE